MPTRIIRVERTPNPNAFKCVVEPPPGVIRSFFNAAAAENDPLGRALFAIDGVTNVLVHESFITISKSPDAKWPAIKKSVEAALSDLGT